MYTYIYIYIYIYISISLYIYIYIERENTIQTIQTLYLINTMAMILLMVNHRYIHTIIL